MFTPQQVQEKCFSKAFMGGYDMGEVDDFLDVLTEDYSALYKENALLKSKMKVLVEKIEEYRATEESMRQALKSAKAMASDIVQEAQRKSEATAAPVQTEAVVSEGIAASAELKALRARISQEKEKLQGIKAEQVKYIEGMRRVLRAQGEIIDKYEQGQEPEEPVKQAEPVVKKEPQVEVEEQVQTPQFRPAPVWEQEEPEVEETVQEDSTIQAELDREDTIAEIVESVNRIADDEERRFEDLAGETRALDFGPTGDADVDQIGMFDNDPTIKIPVITDEDIAADREKKEPKHKFNFTNLQFGKDYEIK